MKFTCIAPLVNSAVEFDGDASTRYALFGRRGRGPWELLCGVASKDWRRLPEVVKEKMTLGNLDGLEFVEAKKVEGNWKSS